MKDPKNKKPGDDLDEPIDNGNDTDAANGNDEENESEASSDED